MKKRIRALYYIFKSDFIRELADLKHYSFNYVVGIINQSILCYLLIDVFSKEGETFAMLIGKFFIWYVGRDLISEMASSINEEKQFGTLEYIYLNVHRLESYLLVKSLSTALWSILFFVVISGILFMYASLDSHVAFGNMRPRDIAVIASALVACLGYGYFFAGLSLIFRKVSSFVSIFGYLILFAQFISVDSKYSMLTFLVPGAWDKYQVPLNITAGVSLLFLLAGWLSFSVSLKLSTKGGTFWRA